MVLLNRPEYRSAFQGDLEFRECTAIRIAEPRLDAPLENTPYLYQLWGTMTVRPETGSHPAIGGWLQVTWARGRITSVYHMFQLMVRCSPVLRVVDGFYIAYFATTCSPAG